jgi:cholinesterase
VLRRGAKVIQSANDAIQSSLKQYGDKVIYYDSFKYMTYVFKTASLHGFTAPSTTTVYCDGLSDAIWKDCVTDKHGDRYLWMNFIQPTTKFHWYIANSMRKTINKHFGLPLD